MKNVDAVCISEANRKYEQLRLLNEFFDNDIPEKYNKLFKETYNSNTVILEYLKSINPNIVVKLLQENFPTISNISVNGNIISFNYKNNIKENLLFKYILSIYNYRIHTDEFTYMILEQCFPHKVYTKFHVAWHITDSSNKKIILETGLRAKYCAHEIEKHIKLKQDRFTNNFAKIYLIAMEDISNDKIVEALKLANSKLKYNNPTVFKINIPNITLYKDDTMFDDYSYYTYNNIPKEYITEYKIDL